MWENVKYVVPFLCVEKLFIQKIVTGLICQTKRNPRAPLYLHGLMLIPAFISNYMYIQYYMWVEIICQISKFNSVELKVRNR